ncbi:integrase [Agrilactobacillus composti DSM 18527 = JCM 14202]|nr:site-specific integrase [Agrilactobacillus composti]GAF41158.1 integrase [Agrilactobacillus composti DSM 18527 = JCM 14202]
MASIKQYKNKNGEVRYRVRVFGGQDPVTNKEQRLTRQGFRTKKEASIAARELETKIASPNYVRPTQLTFEQVYDSWFEQYQNTVKESTWVKTQDIFRLHILPLFGDKQLAKITPVDCQNAINGWFKQGLTKYKVFFNNVSRVFQYAIRMDLVETDPTKKVIKPQNKNRPVTSMADNYYDLDELKKLFSCLYDEDNLKAYVFFRFLAFTGARKGEALALTWQDISFNDKTIAINKTQTRGKNARLLINSPKTYNSIRVIHVDEKTLEVLKQWRLTQRQTFLSYGINTLGAGQLVFTNQYNEMLQPSKPRVWLEHTIDKYDLKHITIHGFRHTYATLAFESGLSIKEVQAQLGHRNFQTTMDIYTAVTNKQKSEIADKFSKYVNF